MEHTGGEWASMTVEMDYYNRIHIISHSTSDTQICEIHRFGFGMDWLKESEANAKLIVAAPELLEACIKAMNIVDLWKPTDNVEDIEHIGEYASLGLMRQAFEKAIKKATK